MLSRLVIRNYALIENLDIQFSEGLNILTGETGAGKSIIMGALSLILGNRAESRYFFDQQKKCIIEGFFEVDDYHLGSFFEEHELDYESESVLRREISPEGKSRAFINDTPVNLNILKQLGELLIDIHSQQATAELNDEAFQRLVLDSLANNEALLQSYQDNYKSYRAKISKLNELRSASAKTTSELDYLQYQFDELETAGLSDGEQEALEQELQTLSHAEEIKRSLLAALYLLNDNEHSVIPQLKESLLQVQQSAKYLQEAELQAARVQSCLIELKDISSEIETLEGGTSLNEVRSTAISERLSVIYSLQKKHQLHTVGELLQLQGRLEKKIASLGFADEEIAQLESETKLLQEDLIRLSQGLSDSRDLAVPRLEEQVEALLKDLGIPNARLKVQNELLSTEALNSFGRNRINFLFSANKGQALAPMSKVASGGELSRLMLSIKSILSQHMALPTIIFDEIDTGISGEVALKVGKIMERLSHGMQVIAITHLPQIASKGKAHYHVYKDDRIDKTHTNIRLLNSEERIVEIGKMLSGENPGEAALRHARELLSAVENTS